MITELLLFSVERWLYWTNLIGKTYTKVYPAESGSQDEAYVERRRLISVAPSSYDGYIEIVSVRL